MNTKSKELCIFFCFYDNASPFLKKIPIFLELAGIVIMETREEHKFWIHNICWTKKCGQNWNRAEQTDKLDKCFSLPFLSLCLQISVSHLTLVRSWHAQKVANWENWWQMGNRIFLVVKKISRLVLEVIPTSYPLPYPELEAELSGWNFSH